MKKSPFFIFLLFILLLTLISACKQQQKTIKSIEKISSEDIFKLSPEQVVTLYFQAWNDKKYDVMYSLISDGFKQLEPTAKTFDDFKLYMESFYKTASTVNIAEAKESYNKGQEAGVGYKIVITNKDNSKKEFVSTYTLKKRVNGWKLIHPYGENIDTT